MYKLVLEKPRGARAQTAYIQWIIEKAREFQKHIYFCFIDYAKAVVWITTNWEDSSRDGKTTSTDLPLEKAIFMSGSKL